MKITGERLIRKIKTYWAIEHLHRYGLAQKFIKDKHVVDIACGDGYGSYLMSKYASNVVGIDILLEAVNHAKNHYQACNLEFIQGSAYNIPLKDKSIDVVVSFETIEHHDRHQQMMTEVLRILKDDGLLIISSPDKLNYSDKPKYKNPFHVKELYFHEFKYLIQNNFSEVIFLRQKSVIGSLVFSAEANGKLIEFCGDYNHISEQEIMKDPLYHIAFCSNAKIETNLMSNSFFSAEEFVGSNVDGLFRSIDKNIEDKANLYRSIQYRIGEKVYNFISPIVSLVSKTLKKF